MRPVRGRGRAAGRAMGEEVGEVRALEAGVAVPRWDSFELRARGLAILPGVSERRGLEEGCVARR